MSDLERQQQLVFWGYVIQWLTFLIPLALLASVGYVALVRGRVPQPALRSHLDWQLATGVLTLAIVVICIALLFLGMRGINTDAPIAIVATYTLMALLSVAPLWLIYRFTRGTLRFRSELPMESLLI